MEPGEAIDYLDTLVVAHHNYEVDKERVQFIGDRIVKAMRTASGLSIRKYAAALGVSYGYLAKVERRKESLSPELAERMMQYDSKSSDC